MDIQTYLSQERGRLAALAKAIGAHAPDLSRWARGKRPIPVVYGAAIELATGGQVTRREMFPEEWRTIWPELVEQPYNRRRDDPPVEQSEPNPADHE